MMYYMCLDPESYSTVTMEGNLVSEVGMVVLDILALYSLHFKVTFLPRNNVD